MKVSPVRTSTKFGCGFVVVVVTLNLYALGVAWQDRSFIAFGIAILEGPIGNVLLALLSLAAIPLLRMRPDFSLKWHLVLSIGVPLIAIVADYLIIFSMGLHGC